MNAQPQLFDAGFHPRKTTQERFEEFHRRHPHIYRLLLTYAREAKQRGFRQYAIKTIWELVRWHSDVITGTGAKEEFRLDNNYPSFYARLLMRNEPDLAGFFHTRESRSR